MSDYSFLQQVPALRLPYSGPEDSGLHTREDLDMNWIFEGNFGMQNSDNSLGPASSDIPLSGAERAEPDIDWDDLLNNYDFTPPAIEEQPSGPPSFLADEGAGNSSLAAAELPQHPEPHAPSPPPLPLPAGSYLQSNFLPYQHNPYNSYLPPNSFNYGASTSSTSNSPLTPQARTYYSYNAFSLPYSPTPQSALPTPPVPVAQNSRHPSSKPRRQPATRAPRRNHPKDDELSKTTVFHCQWVSTPNSAPCGKAIVSREKMLEHLNSDHERIETDKRRSCLWLGCKYGDPDRPLSATSSFNNHVEDVHLKVEGSRKRNVRFDPY